jgi:hypothetical protein
MLLSPRIKSRNDVKGFAWSSVNNVASLRFRRRQCGIAAMLASAWMPVFAHPRQHLGESFGIFH